MVQNGFNTVLKMYNLDKTFITELFNISIDTVNSWSRKTITIPLKYVRELSVIFQIPEKYLLLKELSDTDKLYIEKYYLEYKLRMLNDKITFKDKEQRYNNISMCFKLRCGGNYYYITKDDVVVLFLRGIGEISGSIQETDGKNIKFKKQNGELIEVNLSDIYLVNFVEREFVRNK